MKELNEKEISQLSKEEQQLVLDGARAFAIPVHKPMMSGLWFAALAGLMVAALIVPFMGMVVGPMEVAIGWAAALAWMVSFKIQDNAMAEMKTNHDVQMQITKFATEILAERLINQLDTEGTSDDETCLKEESDGSGSVQE